MEEPEGAHHRLLVLVVTEDESLETEARYGFPTDIAVETARDAREAVAMMRDVAPSLVIVDLKTGSAGGVNLLKEMRNSPRLADVPSVVVLEREHDRWLAMEAGADAVRLKPIDSGDLVADALALVGG